MEIIGLIPAGGIGSRLGKSPCSKEIFPVPLSINDKISVVSENLIHYFKLVDITRIYFILRKGKWDIPEFYGDGSAFGVNIGYLIMNLPFGTPFTIDQAYPFINNKIVALGFPDILFKPENAYAALSEKLINGESDVVLGLFPITSYLKWDMVEFDKNNRVKNIVIKQDRPDLKLGWTNVMWKPGFTEFMHGYLKNFIGKYPDGMFKLPDNSLRELYVGDIIQEAILQGMKVDYVKFNDGQSIDLGTPDDLRKHILEQLK